MSELTTRRRVGAPSFALRSFLSAGLTARPGCPVQRVNLDAELEFEELQVEVLREAQKIRQLLRDPVRVEVTGGYMKSEVARSPKEVGIVGRLT